MLRKAEAAISLVDTHYHGSSSVGRGRAYFRQAIVDEVHRILEQMPVKLFAQSPISSGTQAPDPGGITTGVDLAMRHIFSFPLETLAGASVVHAVAGCFWSFKYSRLGNIYSCGSSVTSTTEGTFVWPFRAPSALMHRA